MHLHDFFYLKKERLFLKLKTFTVTFRYLMETDWHDSKADEVILQVQFSPLGLNNKNR